MHRRGGTKSNHLYYIKLNIYHLNEYVFYLKKCIYIYILVSISRRNVMLLALFVLLKNLEYLLLPLVTMMTITRRRVPSSSLCFHQRWCTPCFIVAVQRAWWLLLLFVFCLWRLPSLSTFGRVVRMTATPRTATPCRGGWWPRRPLNKRIPVGLRLVPGYAQCANWIPLTRVIIKIGTLPSTVGPHLIHSTTAYVVRVNKPNGNRWQPLDTKYVNPKTNPFSCGPLCTDMHI